MPTYEYRCVAGHQYEKRESFSARARQKCQVCGKQADRMISAPPIIFKGSGFYVTDSRKSAPEAESAASVDTKTTADKKTDAKPAADKKPDATPSGDSKPAEPAAAS